MSLAKGRCIYREGDIRDEALAHNWKDNYGDRSLFICRHCGAFGYERDGAIRFEMTRQRYERRVRRKMQRVG